MNSKGHLYISLSKSVIRILGCGVAMRNESIGVLAMALVLAEILGMVEELVDKR